MSSALPTGDKAKAPPPKSAEPVLGELLHVRQDDDSFGFVHTLQNGNVFYADSETIRTLQSLARTPVKELQTEHPEVLEALSIYL